MSGGVFVIGHSHAGAVVEGARACGLQVGFCNLWFDANAVLTDAHGLRLRADVAGRIAQADTVVSTLGGGAYLVLGLFAGERPFDVLCRGRRKEDLDPGLEVVPVSAVRAALRESEAGSLQLLAQVAAHTRGRLVHLIPPPCTLDWEGGGFRALAARMARLQNAPVPATPTVTQRFLRLWELMAEVHRKAAEDCGAEHPGPPGEARDEEGWLRAGYAADFAHGNAAYGAAALTLAGLVTRA